MGTIPGQLRHGLSSRVRANVVADEADAALDNSGGEDSDGEAGAAADGEVIRTPLLLVALVVVLKLCPVLSLLRAVQAEADACGGAASAPA